MSEDILDQLKEKDLEDSGIPKVECPKCGEMVVPEKMKFVPSTKNIMIRCPSCKEFTVIRKDENYERLLQYMMDTGQVSIEDIEGKHESYETEDNLEEEVEQKRQKRKKKRKSKKSKVEEKDSEDEESDDEYPEDEEDLDIIEEDEYTILEEILKEEKKLTKFQKKHLLDWARIKILTPNEVYTLLLGLGAREEIAKKVSTAYAFALEKKKIKESKYRDAVDFIYRDAIVHSQQFGNPQFVNPFVPQERRGLQFSNPVQFPSFHHQAGLHQNPSFQNYPTMNQPRVMSFGNSDIEKRIERLERMISRLFERLEEEPNKTKEDELTLLRQEIQNLRMEMLRKEIEERDRIIKKLEEKLYEYDGIVKKPKEVQELEVKKEALESLLSKANEGIEKVLNTLTLLTRKSESGREHIQPTKDEMKAALDKLKKAIQKKNI